MYNNLLTEIAEGNLEKLKNIPKIKITIEFSKNLLNIMENNIKKINHLIDSNKECNEFKYISYYYYEKIKNIEKCILYLKKIN